MPREHFFMQVCADHFSASPGTICTAPALYRCDPVATCSPALARATGGRLHSQRSQHGRCLLLRPAQCSMSATPRHANIAQLRIIAAYPSGAAAAHPQQRRQCLQQLKTWAAARTTGSASASRGETMMSDVVVESVALVSETDGLPTPPPPVWATPPSPPLRVGMGNTYQPGDVLGGKYIMRDLLGRGSTGGMYRVRSLLRLACPRTTFLARLVEKVSGLAANLTSSTAV